MSVRQHTYEERLVTTPIADSESISAPAHRRLGFFGLGSVVDGGFCARPVTRFFQEGS